MTCGFAEVNQEFFKVMKEVESGIDDSEISNHELLEQMKSGGFVVSENFDETKMLELASYNSKFSSNSFGLTIAPTLNCNFACPYCYESPEKGLMSKEVMDQILTLIEKMALQKKPIQVTWYGGEPLLGLSCIEYLSPKIIDICTKNDVDYSSYIVTNAYLLNQETVEKLKKYKVTGMQITIDGPPDINNKRRRLRGPTEVDTFSVILNHLKLAISGV